MGNRRKLTPLERILLRAVRLALKEFERISYQKKAAPAVLSLLRMAEDIGARAERSGLPVKPWEAA